MVAEAWRRLADYWIGKIGEDGDLYHRELIDPALLAVLGPVAGLRLLDLGCGTGYLARKLARSGAAVVGIDITEPLITYAREREAEEALGIAYQIADAADLAPIADGSFDVVLSNMVLMATPDAAGAIREAGRVLRPGGRFVASMKHPCFDTGSASGWLVETTNRTVTIARKVTGYREPHADTIAWAVREGERRETPEYHRPLSWYVRTLRTAGFAVTAFEEPEPTEEFVAAMAQGILLQAMPMHCVIGAVKMIGQADAHRHPAAPGQETESGVSR